MNQILLGLLFSIVITCCTPSHSVLNKDFTGITGNETIIDWGNTTYSFGSDSYEIIVFESYISSATIVEQGEYQIMKRTITFEPSMKRIKINPDTNDIRVRGNRMAGGWGGLPKYYSDSVNIEIRNTYFKTYFFELNKRQGYLSIYNPETNRHFTYIKAMQK